MPKTKGRFMNVVTVATATTPSGDDVALDVHVSQPRLKRDQGSEVVTMTVETADTLGVPEVISFRGGPAHFAACVDALNATRAALAKAGIIPAKQPASSVRVSVRPPTYSDE